MTVQTLVSARNAEAFTSALTTPSWISRDLAFGGMIYGYWFSYSSIQNQSAHQITITFDSEKVGMIFKIDPNAQRVFWSKENTTSLAERRAFTEANTLDLARKFILVLQEVETELPWHDLRAPGVRPLSTLERARLRHELPEVLTLPQHVQEVLGKALFDLLDLLERARTNENDLRERAATNARIKRLFDALPAGTLLLRDDGRVLATMTDARGRTTRRSVDCIQFGRDTVIRKDLRLDIRERYKLLTPERVCAIPAEYLSHHQRLELISKAGPLKPRFAEIS